MTNEEKAMEIVGFVLNPKCANGSNGLGFLNNHNQRNADLNNINKCCEEIAMQAMERKDKQFAQEKQQWIEKACEWLENELTYPTMTQEEIKWCQTLIAQFEKAMKGE